MRALHENEVLIGGAFGENFSGLMGIEFEDEIGGDSFGHELAHAKLTYHASPEFNLQAVWGEAFAADPYGFITNTMHLMHGHSEDVELGHSEDVGRSFGGTDGQISSKRQSISATGRLFDKFFYSVGLSGRADDALGDDASNMHLRGAFDITKNFMVGGFLIDGNSKSTNRKYSRVGFDTQADIGNSRISAAFISGRDDVCGLDDCTGSTAIMKDSNNIYSLQWYHVIPRRRGGPGIVPLVRFDHYEQSDGTRQFDEVTLNLGYYLRSNVKVHLEYWDRFNAPLPTDEDSRLTLQTFVGF